MKKRIMTFAVIIIAIIIAFFSFYFIVTIPKNAGEFSVDDFTECVENENFQTEQNYGKITDYKSAAAAGKKAISDRFENSEGGLFEWRGCSVRHDPKNNAYYVCTYQIFPPVMGGGFCVILRADGTVLAIWGVK